MMTPTQVSELIRQTTAIGAIDERAILLVFQARLHNANVRSKWLELRDDRPPYLRAVTITEIDSETELGDDEEPGPEAIFRVTLEKMPLVGALRLFFGSSIVRLGPEIADSDWVEAADMDTHGTFTTHRGRFQCWTLAACRT